MFHHPTMRQRIARERHDEREQDLDRRVIEPAEHPGRDVPDPEPDRDPRDDCQHETANCLGEHEGAADGGNHRRAIRHERGRIVEQ